MKKVKPSTAFLALLFAFLVTMWSSCASTFPYTGPDLPSPVVSIEEFRHVDSISNPRMPHWRTDKIVVITNPLYHGVSFDLDCRNQQLAEEHIEVNVPARSVSKVLITPEDGGCDIKRVPQRFAPL